MDLDGIGTPLIPPDNLAFPFSCKFEQQLRVDRMTSTAVSGKIESEHALRRIRVEGCSREFIQ